MDGRTLQPFEIQQSMDDMAALIDMNSTHPAVVHSELFFSRHMEAVAAGETPQLWAVWSFLQQSKAKARDILLKTAGLYLVWDRDPEQRLMLSRRMLESHLGLWIRKSGSNPVKRGISFSNTIYYRTGEYILTHLEPMYIKLSRAAEQMSLRKQEVREELDQPFNI
jgi:NAD dependent epimerase/dehydratase family enzyme